MPPVIPTKAIHEQWLGLVQPVGLVLAEYGETLRPTHGVPKFEGEGLQALVLDLTGLDEWGRDFDKPWNPIGHCWDAPPAAPEAPGACTAG